MDDRKVAYLVMVTAENNNKYYKMTPRGDVFDVEYGRVGASSQKASYSMREWNKKYNEKIKKGYVDRTEAMEDLIVKEVKKDGSSTYKEIEKKAIAEIVERLQRMAKQAIRDNYTISSNKVTQKMVDEAQDIITELTKCESDITLFNKLLLTLFTTIPRKMGQVSDHMARVKDDFNRILTKEQDLLDVMRGQVVQHQVIKEEENISEEDNNKKTILEELGLEFEECTDDEIAIIKKNLGEIKDKFYKAWKVTNKRTQVKFDNFMKQEGKIKTKLLWHGSRNENWWSIINSGLVLRPTNAVISGKMFGYGIYFAPKARKSLGYTSLNGSYWAGGNSNSAYMSLYEVAYGTPYDVHSFDSKYYNFNYEALQKAKKGAHSLHAHEGQMLRNDEIIVYKEDQITIKYLVELR